MPELPEVEHVRRSLEPVLVGALVRQVELRRRDFVKGGDHITPRSTRSRIKPQQLLARNRITSLQRHGKNLVILSNTGRCICIHLGMSGQLLWRPNMTATSRTARSPSNEKSDETIPLDQLTHVHCLWRLDSPKGPGTLAFRDPRRFGGLWVYESLASLHEHRFAKLGPDALTIHADQLVEALAEKKTSIKAALLDQRVLAGVGNIYADEALFRARIHPRRKAGALSHDEIKQLTNAIHHVLNAAIRSGGSTIRSYVDSTGSAGGYSKAHQVYGRGGKPCRCCGQPLKQMQLAQRTTVCCTRCQKRGRQ